MGKREDTFGYILEYSGYRTSSGFLQYPKKEDLYNSEFNDEVQSVYDELGGLLSPFPLNLRKWDIEVEDIAVELDELLHFNRYRLSTLSSPLYKKLKNFPVKEYKSYCETYEPKCLSAGAYGGKWSNNSCEKQFGVGSTPGVLSGNGSPRWKQRAFYDFVKDLTPLLYDIPLVRVSIWDEINISGATYNIGQVLDNEILDSGSSIMKLIKTRADI
tara:strand:- start:219 stop:863 length:645 start_codon:yes stop_codon:yes gene_type:complete